MKEKKLYIGLDVHKDSIHCGIAWEGRDDPEVYAKWGGANLSVERGLNKLLKKYDLSKDEVSRKQYLLTNQQPRSNYTTR